MPSSSAALTFGNRGGGWLPKDKTTALTAPETSLGAGARRLALVEIEESLEELDHDMRPVEIFVGSVCLLVLVEVTPHRHRDLELLEEGISLGRARALALEAVGS